MGPPPKLIGGKQALRFRQGGIAMVMAVIGKGAGWLFGELG